MVHPPTFSTFIVLGLFSYSSTDSRTIHILIIP